MNLPAARAAETASPPAAARRDPAPRADAAQRERFEDALDRVERREQRDRDEGAPPAALEFGACGAVAGAGAARAMREAAADPAIGSAITTATAPALGGAAAADWRLRLAPAGSALESRAVVQLGEAGVPVQRLDLRRAADGALTLTLGGSLRAEHTEPALARLRERLAQRGHAADGIEWQPVQEPHEQGAHGGAGDPEEGL